MKYKLVIFDFDGTLVNSFPFALSIVDGISDKYQLRKVDMSEIETLRGYDARQLAKRYGVRWWKLPSMIKDAREMMARNAHTIPMFDGAGDTLKQLSSLGITLALVTANSLENARSILGPEIFGLFSYHECGVSLFGKTSKFKKILKKGGFTSSETLCIGDEIRDIQAAKKAGITACAVSWGYTRRDALQAQDPEQIFNNMAEIIQKIKQ